MPSDRPKKKRTRWTTDTARAWLAEKFPHLALPRDWEYEGVMADVNGQCRIHGESVSPRFNSLQRGRGIGCSRCALGRTTEEALAEIAEWAPNLDVDQDWVYESNKVKVVGQCRIHGERVSPRFNHLQQGRGIGCRGCSDSGFDRNAPAVLYFLVNAHHGLAKVGVTNAGGTRDRIAAFEGNGWERRWKEHFAVGAEAEAVEKQLKDLLRDAGLQADEEDAREACGWLRGATEVFKLEGTDERVGTVDKLAKLGLLP